MATSEIGIYTIAIFPFETRPSNVHYKRVDQLHICELSSALHLMNSSVKSSQYAQVLNFPRSIVDFECLIRRLRPH